MSDIECFPILVKVSEWPFLLLNTDLHFKQIMSILYEFVDYVNIWNWILEFIIFEFLEF